MDPFCLYVQYTVDLTAYHTAERHKQKLTISVQVGKNLVETGEEDESDDESTASTAEEIIHKKVPQHGGGLKMLKRQSAA